jgi:F-box/leucine-rich repeat protein 2/20
MEGPSFLPAELSHYTAFETDESLLVALTNTPRDLVNFFEVACEDESWFGDHPKLIRGLLRWVAKKYYLYNLSSNLVNKMVKTIQRHFNFLKPFLHFRPALFYTVKITVENQPVLVNTLLFGASSPFFYTIFRSQCFEKMRDEATIARIPLELFRLVEEHVSTGEVVSLWKLEQVQIIELMKLAQSWSIPGLVKECASVLYRYINSDNVAETLLKAHHQSFKDWMLDCCRFYNDLEWGLRINVRDGLGLEVEFLDYRQETLDRFDVLAPLVTHLSFPGHLSEESYYKIVVAKCPRLIGLNFCNSNRYANQFEGIGQQLSEFDLSACPWLTPDVLREIHLRFHEVDHLSLGNNLHLNYLSWGELAGFKKLRILELSRSNQITDEELKLISRSCPQLAELNLGESHGFSDRGLLEVIHQCHQLRTLNINRCVQLTDKILSELGTVASISSLSVIRCNFSEKTLLRFVEASSSLKYLNVEQCDYSIGALELIRMQHPFLMVLS